MPLYSRESDEIEQLTIGNLALPGSQQPTTLFAFGQNIVDQGDLQLFITANIGHGTRINTTELVPSILYGIQDTFSLYLAWPVAADFSVGNQRASGPEDCIIQGEYAVITKKKPTASDQITCVGALYAPFGNPFKQPSLSLYAPAFFLGITASHIGIDWYWYCSPGALITTSYNHTNRSGNQYLYQAGFGRNIAAVPDRWIAAWIVDLIGNYTSSNRIRNSKDPNSGSNTVALAASLWFSTRSTIFQLGIAPYIVKQMHGNQLSISYTVSALFSYKFQ